MNEVTTIARWFSWTGDSATKSTWWVTKHAGFDFARSLKKHGNKKTFCQPNFISNC